MKSKYYWPIFLLLFHYSILNSQSLPSSFHKNWTEFLKNYQLRHSIISLCILNSINGKVLFSKNDQIGLAPASCNKIITSTAAFHFLGPKYRYETILDYQGHISNDTLYGNLIILGSGDPSLGSPRYDRTTSKHILSLWVSAIKNAGINCITGQIIGDDSEFGTQSIPDGWEWQDIGNYYGAGITSLNWEENKFQVFLLPGIKIGDSVRLLTIKTPPFGIKWNNELLTGPIGTGDQAYAYFKPMSNHIFLRGTVPVDASKKFSIWVSVPDPTLFCAQNLYQELILNGINVFKGYSRSDSNPLNGNVHSQGITNIFNFYSPSLDSLTYWFLHKSINLYGEAFVKKIAVHLGKIGTTEMGMKIIHHFCSKKLHDSTAVNTQDGSGLSPGDRVTTYALVRLLFMDQNEKWFLDFFRDLPLIQGLHMKDGYIGGVRSFTGFLKNKRGLTLIFSFIVNNYSGSVSRISTAMIKVLMSLKK